MLDKIARIQDKIGKLSKDKDGYNYKFFDINQLLEKLQPLLREEGLVITQPIIDGSVVTKIIDISTADRKAKIGNTELVYKDAKEDSYGEEIVSSIKLPENVRPQDLGSAITYYRRYSLVSLLALEAEDDDGRKATAPERKTLPAQAVPVQNKTRDQETQKEWDESIPF